MIALKTLPRDAFCDWRNPDAIVLVCKRCGYSTPWKRNLWVGCAATAPIRGVAVVASTGGVGTEITKMLAEGNLYEQLSCPCKSHALQMDVRAGGVDAIAWCEQNIPWIATVLKQEHDLRGLNIWDQNLMTQVFIPEAIRRAKEARDAKSAT